MDIERSGAQYEAAIEIDAKIPVFITRSVEPTVVWPEVCDGFGELVGFGREVSVKQRWASDGGAAACSIVGDVGQVGVRNRAVRATDRRMPRAESAVRESIRVRTVATRDDVLRVEIRGLRGVAEVRRSGVGFCRDLVCGSGSWSGRAVVEPDPGEQRRIWVHDMGASRTTDLRAHGHAAAIL